MPQCDLLDTHSPTIHLYARKLRNAVCIIDCISLLLWGSTRNLRQYNVFDNLSAIFLSTLNIFRYLSTGESRSKN